MSGPRLATRIALKLGVFCLLCMTVTHTARGWPLQAILPQGAEPDFRSIVPFSESTMSGGGGSDGSESRALHDLAIWLTVGMLSTAVLTRWRYQRDLDRLVDVSVPLGDALTNRAGIGTHRLPDSSPDARPFGRHLDTMPLAVIELDYRLGHPGRISIWSRQACRIFGWSAQEALGRTLDEIGLVHEEDQDRRLATFQALRDEAVDSTEITVRAWTRQRRVLHCAAHVSVARQPDGMIDTILMAVKDVTSSVAAQAEIAHLAHHDPLTGLPNRTLFQERLREGLSVAEQTGTKAALMLIDLDRFKQVNDLHGHGFGDCLLRHVASRLSAAVREVDLPARLGGDEFALVLVALNDAAAARSVAARVLEELAQPFVADGQQVDVSCSIGVALFPEDGTDAEALMRAADLALYRAKGAGRNRFVIHHRDMDRALLRNRSLQSGLNQALAQGRLHQLYRPIIRLSDRTFGVVEALCRWRDKDGKPVPAATFLPLAESCGLSRGLFEWMLRTACSQANAWETSGRPLTISVEVGLTELLRHDFIPYVCGIVSASGVPFPRLQLAFSEDLLSEFSGDALVEKLHGIAGVGIGVAIVGFGTGHCPLAQLAKLPIEEIRIGAAVTDPLDVDEAMPAILRGIVVMARGLGVRATAQQVTSERQAVRLGRIGCDGAQGEAMAPSLTAAGVDRLRDQASRRPALMGA